MNKQKFFYLVVFLIAVLVFFTYKGGRKEDVMSADQPSAAKTEKKFPAAGARTGEENKGEKTEKEMQNPAFSPESTPVVREEKAEDSKLLSKSANEPAVAVDSRENKAPDFSLETIKGDTIRLSDYSGKVVFLNFWGTWCPPCRRELPDFAKFYETYREKGVEIIGIALNSKQEDIEKMVEQYKILYPVCPGDSKIVNDYGPIRFVPTTIVIDKNGVIDSRKIGGLTESALREIADRLL
jgi:thiol-disulfide isomerase/thioredoxin